VIWSSGQNTFDKFVRVIDFPWMVMAASLSLGIATPDFLRNEALRGTTPLLNVLLCFAGAERALDIGAILSGCLIPVLEIRFP
jgi:hypothetical protein